MPALKPLNFKNAFSLAFSNSIFNWNCRCSAEQSCKAFFHCFEALVVLFEVHPEEAACQLTVRLVPGKLQCVQAKNLAFSKEKLVGMVCF